MESLTVGTMERASPNSQLNSPPSRLHHRRAQSLDERLSYQMGPKDSSRSRLWLPGARRQRSISPVVSRSDDDGYRASSPLPPVKPGGPKVLPARSVHAYERSSEDAVGKLSLDAGSVTRTRRSELPTAEDNRGRARRDSQHIAGQYERHVDKSREPSERSCSPFSDSSVTMMPESRLERLVVTPSLGHHDSWTQSVQLMINETADAFEAVHKTMDDASLTSWLLDLPETSETAKGSEMPANFAAPHTTTHHHPEQEDTKSDRFAPCKSTRSSIDKPLPSRPGTPTMNVLKKEIKKAPQARVLRPTKPAKWTVSNSVAQLFSGTRFKRVQVDEMLTPEKIEEMRANRLNKDQQRSSCKGRDSSDSFDSTRSQQMTTTSTKSSKNNNKAEKPSVLPLEEAVIHTDFSLPSISTQKAAQPRARSKRDTIVFTNHVSSLNPPPKNPQRFVFTNTRARLPTIPEAEVESDEEPEESAGRPSTDHSLRSQDSGELVYLPGTQMSAVNSSFKHGRIACQIADSYVNLYEEMDDTINSSAYQMAIQGLSCGNSQTVTYDDDENDMADDMTAWFLTFGFETHGELIPDGTASPCSLSSHSIVSTCPSTVSGDAEAPMPVHSEDGFASTEPIRFFRSHAPPRKWTPEEGSPRHYTLRDAQGQSCKLRSAPLVVGDGERNCVSEQVADSADLSVSMKQDIAALLRWMAAGGD